MSAFIDQHRACFGVEPICRELEVSASAYWERKTKPPSRRAVRDKVVLSEIRRVHSNSYGVYGQWKVWRQLQKDGIIVARCTVKRLMRKHGTEGLRKGKTQHTTIPGTAPVPASDLVKRGFTAERPDQLWVADFTYIRTWEGWSCLAIVLDVHNRRIVGWQMASHMRQSLVSDAFEMALANRQEYTEGGMIAHSDNGAQYTSYEYTKRLVDAGITPSRGRTGTALDNAMAESVISTIKTELTKRHVWRTRLQLELAVVVYIGWYNMHRLHRSLKGRTPREVFVEYNQQQAAVRTSADVHEIRPTSNPGRSKMGKEALRLLRERFLPLHRVWGVPLFIADMYMYACDGGAMSPVDEECFQSGTYDSEELRRYMTALLRALADAADWTDKGWLYGITAGLFTKYPSWWSVGEEGISHQNLNAILNARRPDFPYQDTIQAFYTGNPLTSLGESDGALHPNVLKPYVPPTLAELGYVLPETRDERPDFVIADFEGGLEECDDAPCWDGGGHEKPNPEAYGNLSLQEHSSGGHYLSDDFYYTSWLKVGHGLWLDASGYDGIQVILWASSPMTIDFELGVCVDPWLAYMFRDLEVGTQPRVYRLPFSDFELDGESHVVAEVHLREICGMGFFPSSRGEANAIFIDDLGLYVEEKEE